MKGKLAGAASNGSDQGEVQDNLWRTAVEKEKRLTATAFGAELTWLCNIFTYLVPLFTSQRLSRLQKQVHGRSSGPASLPTQDFRHGRLGLEQVKQ